MSGISFALCQGGIGISFSGGSSLGLCGSLVLGSGGLRCNSGVIRESLLIVISLVFHKGWDIKVISNTFTIVTFLADTNGFGGDGEESENC
jgi:hypothetical protein